MDATFLSAALAMALCLSLGALAFVERRRRRERRAWAAAVEASDMLRDEIWRLEAASAARDRAEAASEAKSRFLATVSHEIRTPLAGIVGTAELLATLPLGAEGASYVGAIRTSGAALRSLIDEILDFSRIEAGRLELADETFDLRPLVEGVMELLAPRAQDQGLAIAALVASDVPATLRGDPARLRQVLLNLAGNAIKFTASGGVGLRVALADGAVRFTVSDTGCGVSEARRHAIFDEFEQGGGDGVHRPGGAGLGLAISRAIAHRMGGALTLDETSDRGSTFTLALPCNAVASETRPSPAASQDETRAVLLAADGPFEAAFLRERLETLGARTVHATNASQAADALASAAPFDVAVLDCALGEAAMRTLAQACRRAGVGRIVVLLSPFERRMLSPASWRDFDGWLVKPVREASLRLCIDPLARAEDGVEARPMPAPRLDGRHVLVAEDDEINALIAQRFLERQGARVTRVADGAAAVASIAARIGVDVVLMDIRMPMLDGLAAARAIRALDAGRALPLIALSANAFEEDRRGALAAGFDLFLVKPVGLEALTGAVAAVLKGRAVRNAA